MFREGIDDGDGGEKKYPPCSTVRVTVRQRQAYCLFGVISGVWANAINGRRGGGGKNDDDDGEEEEEVEKVIFFPPPFPPCLFASS